MWKCVYLPWHKLRIDKIFKTGGKQVNCTCGKIYAMNDRTKSFLDWDSDFDELYTDVPYIQRKYEK